MPKINRFQIINFRYSKGLRLLTDKIMFLNGDSTQFEATNSVGKSMQIQTLLQSICPLVDVSKKSIDIYTVKQPVYSMIEWILNDGKTILLTGIGFERKLSVSDDETATNRKNELFKYFTFTVEYGNNANIDIENIGIIEYDSNGNKKINSLSTVENNLRNLSKGSNGKINVFAQSANSRYSEKLYEYGISQKEFKDIIVKLNDGEAVLSSFFEQYSTNEKLFRNKIIPLIENNLVDDNNIPRIKKQKENISKFIESVINNKDGLINYENFNILLKKIEELELLLFDVINSEKDKEESIKKLSDLFYLCEEKYLEIENEISIKNSLLNEAKKNKNQINFEKRSYKYRLNEDEVNKIELEITELNKKLLDLKSELNTYLRDLNTIELKEIDIEIKECNKEIIELETEREVLSAENKEIVNKMNELGSAIKYHLNKEIDNLKNKIETSKNYKSDIIDDKSSKNNAIKECHSKITELSALVGIHKSKVKNFDEKFENLSLENPFLNNYVHKLIDKTEIKFIDLLRDLDDKIKNNEKELNNIKDNISKIDSNISKIEQENVDIDKKNTNLSIKRNDISKKLNEFNYYKNNLAILVNDFELDEKILWDNTKQESLIDNKLKELDNIKENLSIQKHNLQKDIKRIEKGGIININNDLLDELESYGVTAILGSEYLLRSKNKEDLLKNNPLLPYSIVITNNEFNKLSKIKIKTFSESLIPVIIRENINNVSENSIYTIFDGLIVSNDMSFLNSVDLTILDPQLKDKELSIKRNLLNNIQNNIDNTSLSINKLIKIKSELLKNNFNKDDEILLNNKANEINYEIDNNKELIVANNSLVNKFKDDISKLNNESLTYDKDLLSDKTLYSILLELSKDFKEIEDNKDSIIEKEEEISNLNKKILILEDEIKNSDNLLDIEKDKLLILEKELEDKVDYLKRYNIYPSIDKTNLSLEYAINKYMSLSKDYHNSNITDIEKKLSQLKDKYDKLSKKKDDCISEAKGLIDLELGTILLSKEKLRNKRDQLKIDIENKETEFNNLEKNKSSKEGSLGTQKETILKDFGKNPCNKEDILDLNFNNRLSKVTNEIDELNNDITSLNNTFIKIKTILDDLKNYKQERRAYQIDTNIEIDTLKDMLKDNISKTTKSLALNIKKYEICLSEIDDFNAKTNFNYDIVIKVIKNNKDIYENQITNISNVKTFIQEQIKIYACNKESVEKVREATTRDLINYCKDVVEELRVFNRLGKMSGEQYFEINLQADDKIRYEEVINDIMSSFMVADDTKDVLSKIDTFYLLNRLISINSLRVRVILFELNGRKEKLNWNDVLANTSGGQRFCISFVVLTLLMEYKRYDSKKINKNTTSKVLIMDNPFGETSEEDFLIQVFQLAEKFNVQIISYTHITNISVRNRFKKIYKMTVEQTIGGKEIVLIENEKIEEDEYVNNLKYHISPKAEQFSLLDEIK